MTELGKKHLALGILLWLLRDLNAIRSESEHLDQLIIEKIKYIQRVDRAIKNGFYREE